MRYSQEQVLHAARVAYRSSISGGDDCYVDSKSTSFVRRCVTYEGDSSADGLISQATVKEIAFEALDPYCTAQLYLVLDSYREEEYK